MSNRIFYAVQNVDLAGVNSGWQSVGINGTVDFEQIFELGRLDIYKNIEGVPSVEVTLERILPSGGNTVWEALGNDMTAAAAARPTLNMQVANDNVTPYTAEAFVQCTGLYLSSYSVNFQIDGAMTESVTLVGNHLNWTAGASGATIQPSGTGLEHDGSLIRRQDVTGVAPYPLDRLQSLTISMDFSREDLFELGSKSPYYKAAGFPIEVTAEMEYLATKDVTGLEFEADQNADVTGKQTVSITALGKTYSMGEARLTASNYSGGDAGGGNATISYSFVGYNYYKVT